MDTTKYYLVFGNGSETTKGHICATLDDALKVKERLEKEHEPRKWFIVEVETTGKGITAY